MKKIERLNWIILTLKQRGKMSAAQLARHMEVSPRTIYRDMTALSEIQVPVRALDGAEGGYEIDPDYFLGSSLKGVGSGLPGGRFRFQ